MKASPSFISAIVMALGFCMTQAVSAAVIPSSWDFGTDPGKDNASAFTSNAGGASAWSLQPDAYRYTGVTSGARTGGATTSFTNLSSGPGFKIEVTATPSYRFADYLTILTLGTSAAGGTTTNVMSFNGISGRFRNVQEDGTARVMDIFNHGTSVVLKSAAWTLGTGAIDFVLSGEFIGADLKLTLKGTNSSNVSQEITYTILNHTFTSSNTYAGFGGYIAGGSRTLNFDTFAISVIPEPGSLALVAAGTLLIGFRGRRKA
jgi:hypothetical protein